jgi:electron transfer flavoprotein beta subunit
MSDLHTVVCMKVVPKPEEIRVDPESRTLLREGARSEINPPDMNALEMALSIKDEIGGRISLISMGPPFVEEYLRVGLAMGADDAYLLTDRAFAGADTLATTYTLAQCLHKIGEVEVVILGEESSDGATGQVPPGLAEWMDYPLITLLQSLEVDREQNVLRGRRNVDGGYEILEVPLPAVISVATAANEPRFMDFERKGWAFEHAQVTMWDAQELNAETQFIGIPGSPTIVTGLEQAASQERKNIFLEGSATEIADQLVRILRKN